MQLTELQQRFNGYTEERKQEFRMLRIDTQEDRADGTPGNVCTFVGTHCVAGTIYVNGGEI
ncbi:MAG: hypothetical protein ACRDBM_07000 [Sporomusa sp.]